MAEQKIRRALIAVYDKTGIVDFARALHDEFGIEIISTGGTAKVLKDAGIPVTLVEQVTGFPEMLDGRVKTLHPKIHAAILADRDNPEHMRQLAEHGIEPIDMVVVNLYPFEKTIADPNCKFEDAIEMIDIGGPCLLRAAAKNHMHVLVLDDPQHYEANLDLQRTSTGCQKIDQLITGAMSAFWKTAQYDATVASWLSRNPKDGLPCFRAYHYWNWGPLRYGENPHQLAELLSPYPCETGPDLTAAEAGVDDQDNWQARISYNNYADAGAALNLCSELARTSPILWHRFPTGEVCDRFSTGRNSTPPASSPRISGETLTRRNLPHIQNPGSTYFITFRVKSGTFSPQERDIVLSACQYWHTKKMTLHAAVVMPDHVHLLLTPHEISPDQWVPLGELLHSIKRHSALEINKLRKTSGPIWLDESFDRIMRDETEFIEKWEYMEANPVTAGIAKTGEYNWFWKSETGFQETIGGNTNRLKTGSTEHRLKTGATEKADTTNESQATINHAHVAVFIKHTNSCGVGIADHPIEAYRRAYLGDPNAAMGGILAHNYDVNADIAEAVMDSLDRWGKAAGAGAFFVEVWLAPSFDDDAVKIIRERKKWGANVRLLSVGDMTAAPDPNELEYKSIVGGMLVQTRDLVGLNEEQWKSVTKRAPTESEISDMKLAWLIAKHTKSNAISICKDGMLIGNGAGQMSRVMSCRIATWLAKENGHADKLAGSAAASDAFFPFRDGPDLLIDAGITAIIQPGGSKRDEETIKACDERGVAMIFTGTRHFKH